MEKIVLLYGFSKKEFLKLKYVFQPLGIKLIEVSPDDYTCTLGEIVKADGSGRIENAVPAIDNMGKMAVMGGLESEELNSALAGMRMMGFSRDVLKAVITPDNMQWSGLQLYGELFREHTYMSEKKQG